MNMNNLYHNYFNSQSQNLMMNNQRNEKDNNYLDNDQNDNILLQKSNKNNLQDLPAPLSPGNPIENYNLNINNYYSSHNFSLNFRIQCLFRIGSL